MANVKLLCRNRRREERGLHGPGTGVRGEYSGQHAQPGQQDCGKFRALGAEEMVAYKVRLRSVHLQQPLSAAKSQTVASTRPVTPTGPDMQQSHPS